MCCVLPREPLAWVSLTITRWPLTRPQARRQDQGLTPRAGTSPWLPVASDGCGNYYVLTLDEAVGFVDIMKDPGQLDRRAAPDLLSFMSGLLRANQQPPDPPVRR